MDKRQEVEYSSLFLAQLNREKGLDYRAIPNQDEATSDHEVDVFGESESHERLRLQVKIIDRGYMPGVVSRAKEAEQNPEGVSGVYVRDLDPVKWAKQAIAECGRKYEPNVRKGLVLLLCVYHGGEMNQEYAAREFEEYRESDFKGIYLVDPPRTLANSIREYPGQITPVKALIF